MVAHQDNKNHNEFYKENVPSIAKENLTILKIKLDSLPKEINKRINSFRLLKKKVEKKLKTSSNIKLYNEQEYRQELDELIKIILDKTKLPPEIFTFYIGWYLQTETAEAPGMNFRLYPSETSVVVEFFRSPRTKDWIMVKRMVREDFKSRLPLQNVHIDPRQANTIDSKLIAAKHKITYDAVDEIFGSKTIAGLKDDDKKAAVIRQYRSRILKVKKRLS